MAVVSVISIFSDIAQLTLLNYINDGGYISDATAEANDSRQQMIGVLQLILIIVTGVTFLVWVHHAYKNLQSFRLQGLRYSPGWAVGYYFIPILSLYRPYQVMREVWKGSAGAFDVNSADPVFRAPSSQIVGWWWFFFLISNFISNFVFRLVLSSDTVEDYIFSTQAYIVSSCVDIVGILVTILLIKKIVDLQEDKNRRMSSIVQPVSEQAVAE